MAGIWERVKENAVDRVPSHLLDAAFVLNGTGDFTSQQIVDALNDEITVPLNAAELTDLNNIASQLASQSNNTLKLIYLEKIKAIFIAAESGSVNETKFRDVLDIA